MNEKSIRPLPLSRVLEVRDETRSIYWTSRNSSDPLKRRLAGTALVLLGLQESYVTSRQLFAISNKPEHGALSFGLLREMVSTRNSLASALSSEPKLLPRWRGLLQGSMPWLFPMDSEIEDTQVPLRILRAESLVSGQPTYRVDKLGEAEYGFPYSKVLQDLEYVRGELPPELRIPANPVKEVLLLDILRRELEWTLETAQQELIGVEEGSLRQYLTHLSVWVREQEDRALNGVLGDLERYAQTFQGELIKILRYALISVGSGTVAQSLRDAPSILGRLVESLRELREQYRS